MAGKISLSDSWRIHDRAASPVSAADLDQRGEFDRAGSDPVQASRFERASGRKLCDRRDSPFDSRKRSRPIRRKRRDGAQQSLRIRMSGRTKDIGLTAELDQIARVHDGDAIGNVRDHGEIVRNEKHRQSKFLAQIVEQIENLLLDGDIKRGSRLVGNQQLRTIDNGHGNHDALAHASGELVRIAAGALLGLGDGNVAHAFNCSAPCFGFGNAVMSEYRFRDLLADTHHGIERSHRLLENHGDARPAKLTQLIGGQNGQMHRDAVPILISDFSCDQSGWRKQAHDGERGYGFSRARFANQAQYFARCDGE